MASPGKQSQPEKVAEVILQRVNLSQMARKLKTTLQFAKFKTVHRWEGLTLADIEPRMAEQFRRRRPTSAGDDASLDSSSSPASSEPRYTGQLLSSPLRGALFSDAVDAGSGSTGRRKRHFDGYGLPDSVSSKRFHSSPLTGREHHTSWKEQHHLAQSSPIKPREHLHFTTAAGPDISLFRGSAAHAVPRLQPSSFDDNGDNDDDDSDSHEPDPAPVHPPHMASSPPRTPPMSRRRLDSHAADAHGRSVEGADLLLYLATSPSPAMPARRTDTTATTTSARMGPPPQTPPQSRHAGTSLLATPGAGPAPQTPLQTFNFADYCNVTPSPAQPAWGSAAAAAAAAHKTPGASAAQRTPGLQPTRRGLTFDNIAPLAAARTDAPADGGAGGAAALGPVRDGGAPDEVRREGRRVGAPMQLGGNLMA